MRVKAQNNRPPAIARHKRAGKNKKLLLVAGLLFAVYAVLAVYNASAGYTMDEMGKNIAKLQKENTQLHISQTQSSSLDNILAESVNMLYMEVGRISYIEKPSISPFAVK